MASLGELHASTSLGAAMITREKRLVILASSLGTVFEWYDFYLVGSLAAFIAASMFAGINPTAAFIFALLSFAATVREMPSMSDSFVLATGAGTADALRATAASGSLTSII
jgi:hypothetical protein